MKCTNCQYTGILEREIRNIKYEDCGLDNVTVVGVKYARCPSCGEEYYGFRRIDELHSVIAKALIRKKAPLRSSEFRFLRKYLGLARDVFATRIDRAMETLSRYETGERPIPPDLDLLIRSLVANKNPDRDYDFHELFLDGFKKTSKPSKLPIMVKAESDHWSLATV